MTLNQTTIYHSPHMIIICSQGRALVRRFRKCPARIVYQRSYTSISVCLNYHHQPASVCLLHYSILNIVLAGGKYITLLPSVKWVYPLDCYHGSWLSSSILGNIYQITQNNQFIMNKGNMTTPYNMCQRCVCSY
jgi:hypothetical protein